MQRVPLIFHNAYASGGKSRKGLGDIIATLRDRGLEYKLLETKKIVEENRELLSTAYSEFSPTEIWVSGGDGTLQLLINSLPENMWHLPVAVIPTGSGNDFIKNYLQGTSVSGAIHTALFGEAAPCDVWQCNGRLFVHGLGVGFDGKVVEALVKKRTLFSGFLAYYYHVLRLLPAFREKDFTMEVDGQVTPFPCFMITVANSTTFGGGFKITPNAKISDGLLDVCAIGGVPMWKRPGYLKIVEKGRHLQLPYVNYFTTEKIILNAPHEMPGHIDGELFYSQRFEISSYTKKLLVIGAGN